MYDENTGYFLNRLLCGIMGDMKIYFIRHGESEHNKLMREMIPGAKKDTGIASPVDSRDLPLTEEGKIQIQHILNKIKEDIDALYCGESIRTRSSAEIICDTKKVSPIIDPRINATFCGELDHRSFDEMKELTGVDFEKQIKNGTYDFSAWGGETFQEVHNRVKDFLIDIVSRYTDDQIIVVVASVESITPVYNILFGKISPTIHTVIRIKNGSLHEFNITKDLLI